MSTELSVIVLSVQSYNETSSLVHAYSRQRGRVLLWLSLSKSRAGRSRQNLFQPLSMLELVVSEKKGGASLSVREARVAVPFRSIPFSPLKMSICLFLSEFLSNVLREESPDGSLFDYVTNSILWLDEAERGISNFHLVFLMHISRFLGFYPNMDDYREGDVFDLVGACFTSGHPLHGQVLESKEAAIVAGLMRMNYMNMHLFALQRGERQRIIDVLMQFYSLHVGGFSQMRSLDVLRELFS